MIHAVIVNYHRPDITRRAVASVLAEGARVILVDNDSDGAWAFQEYADEPRVAVRANADNLGFGAGCNQGIEMALADGTEGVLLLNNDALLEPGALAPLAEAAARHGLAAPKILLPGGELYAAGGLVELSRARCRNRGLREPDAGQYDQAALIRFSSACALMLSRAALDSGARFFEPFFLYYEDADFCLALARAGFKIAYVPGARVIHLESASTAAEGNATLLYYDFRNRWIFLRRQGTLAERLAGGAYLLGVGMAKALSYLIKGRGPLSRAILQGLWDAFLHRGGKRNAASRP